MPEERAGVGVEASREKVPKAAPMKAATLTNIVFEPEAMTIIMITRVAEAIAASCPTISEAITTSTTTVARITAAAVVAARKIVAARAARATT